ncbi:GTPase [Tersicoccus sp. Bi-70]|uniref:GTPase n=1 Tax=Tersicoccus sp. Bi-70 TaxID=1897634 RepID=UPI0009774F99|nr:GTPase [Tersicoccus sp. Bi-70]OMH36726.1 ABC transporter [Tersicoccus sp. Bi-70]
MSRTRPPAFAERIDALEQARRLADGVLPDGDLAAVDDVLARAKTRRSLSAAHTVVGFFGATGSGKSSLFNAVAGAPIARAAATRPTTSQPLAAVWGEQDSDALLDWLGVQDRHVLREDLGDGGLILLDLPDFDSTHREHRDVVERLASMVDVLVWVLDPQKYADLAVHQGFLQPLASHGPVMLAVLNQADRVSAHELPAVLGSLRDLLDRDGLARMEVFATSAATGAGVDALQARIHGVAAARTAAVARLEADVVRAAHTLARDGAEGFEGAAGSAATRSSEKNQRARLARDLSVAANVETVARASGRSWRKQAGRRTGWPVTRWIGSLGPDPLRRLNLHRRAADPAVNRTSLPRANAAQDAVIDAAVRDYLQAAGAGMPSTWQRELRADVRRRQEQLPDALDRAIAGTDLGAGRTAWWWPVVSVVQWLALAAALVGALWLLWLAALAWFQLPVPPTPRVEGWPVPTLLILVGILVGVLLGALLSVVNGAAAAARTRRSRRRLRAAVDDVAQRLIVAPAEQFRGRWTDFAAAVDRARA